ncbi:MAG TPA: cobalamin-independent methionine synthase II family protein [Xanthobacteraceae bacterium]|jgi:5-methyltetrahydropteroyltriglutamate--homocysteine methyltransferase|nr:cobalamin-independent methionine synthase II family protein [Xanthobacteraceae bacterium]
MKRSTDRILTTHVGSLIRPPRLREFLAAKEAGKPFDEAAYAKCLKECVAEVVRKQADIGLDVVSDGEFGKAISWAQYALFRLGGFERRPFAGGNPFTRGVDRTRFADFYAELDARDKVETVMDSVAVAPITYAGAAELKQDIDNFKDALRAVDVVEGFLPVAAPPSVIPDRKNEYYKSDDDLQQAIAEAMRVEYKTIVDAGLLVQLDDARAAVSYDRMVPPKTLEDYRAWLARQVEMINHAIEGLPREKIRYHVCWGSWPGPHSSDVPFKDIADLVLQVRAGGYSIELANPRHEHEWRLWEHLKLPADTVLIPGVISHATNIVEHPELVAERIVRLARLVGRENVIASTDCGFAQVTYFARVHPQIVWAKLEALVEGARLASKELWGRGNRAPRSAA